MSNFFLYQGQCLNTCPAEPEQLNVRSLGPLRVCEHKAAGDVTVPDHLAGGALCKRNINTETGEDCSCGAACHVCRLDSQNRDVGCAVCRYKRYEHDGDCRKECPAGSVPVGSGSFGRQCVLSR